MTVTPLIWSWSVREKVAVNGLKPPAWLLVVPAVNDGLKPPPHPLVIWKLSAGVAGGPEPGADHGVSDVPVVYVPHAEGVVSGARGPPNRCSFRSLNWNCGS